MVSSRFAMMVALGLSVGACGSDAGSDDLGQDHAPLVTATPVVLGLSPAAGWAVNDAGQVAGALGLDAYVWSGGTTTILDRAGYDRATAFAISPNGDAAGDVDVISSTDHRATVWPAGSSSAIVVSVADSNFHHVNASLQAAGTWDGLKGLFWSPTTGSVDIGNLGGDATYVYDMNELGQVVGMSLTTNSALIVHAYVWQGGTMTDLGTLGGTTSGAFAINDLGVVAGGADTPSEILHATLWSGGVATDLDPTHPEESIAYGLNDAGDAVGHREIGGVKYATLWRGGDTIDLGAGPNSTALDVNAQGVVLIDGADGPLLWSDADQGAMALPAPAGVTVYSAYDISATRVVGASSAGPIIWEIEVVAPPSTDPIEDLGSSVDDLVTDGTISAGNGNALTSKLDAAAQKCAKGNQTAAENQINAFINQVEAFVSSGKLTAAEGAALIAEAEAALAALDC